MITKGQASIGLRGSLKNFLALEGGGSGGSNLLWCKKGSRGCLTLGARSLRGNLNLGCLKEHGKRLFRTKINRPGTREPRSGVWGRKMGCRCLRGPRGGGESRSASVKKYSPEFHTKKNRLKQEKKEWKNHFTTRGGNLHTRKRGRGS